MKADYEDEVVGILKDAGFWDEPKYWRDYGDVENNYSSAGNQASNPESALVEKITNARDALLMNACLEREIDPKGDDAPGSLKDAVAQFFEDNPNTDTAGQVKEWDNIKRTEIAENMTVALTGAMPSEGNPSIIVADRGEGQKPLKMPSTILSLQESIKLRIPFVHGKFNMGGTAVLRFCGKNNLQFVLSKRNPKILELWNEKEIESDNHWGFTIVRRDFPEEGKKKGVRVSSVYRYLAPLGDQEKLSKRKGEILHFESEEMPLFPDGQNPFARSSEYGTLLKLYEYKTKNRTHFFRDGGLLRPLDLRIPEIGLPIRLYECRSNYKGEKRSFETTLSGLTVRLHDDRGNNLEEGFPTHHPIRINGEDLKISVYAFKEGKARTYRNADEAILYTLNGQTQHFLPERFFMRKKIKMGYLKDSLLVMVNCSDLSKYAREELFMNSRDRVSSSDLSQKIEDNLETLISEHKGLRELNEKRRREKKAAKLEDSKPLEKVLESVIKHSPTLSQLFSVGKHLSNPFKSKQVESEEKKFEGKKFPTYFKFKKVEYGEVLERNCHINQRSRIFFESDAKNDYFGRNIDPGEFSLYLVNKNGQETSVDNYSLNPNDGVFTLNLELPDECEIGDKLRYKSKVTDPTRLEEVNPPFVNEFVLKVLEPIDYSPNGNKKRRKPPTENEGNDRELPSGIQLPEITLAYENPEEGKGISWEDVPNDGFNKYSALRVIQGLENGKPIYDFYINMDNIYLNMEIKSRTDEALTLTSQYKYGLVLLGLSIIHHEEQGNSNGQEKKEESDISLEEKIELFSEAVSPVLLPMIDELSDKDFDDELAALLA